MNITSICTDTNAFTQTFSFFRSNFPKTPATFSRDPYLYSLKRHSVQGTNSSINPAKIRLMKVLRFKTCTPKARHEKPVKLQTVARPKTPMAGHIHFPWEVKRKTVQIEISAFTMQKRPKVQSCSPYEKYKQSSQMLSILNVNRAKMHRSQNTRKARIDLGCVKDMAEIKRRMNVTTVLNERRKTRLTVGDVWKVEEVTYPQPPKVVVVDLKSPTNN